MVGYPAYFISGPSHNANHIITNLFFFVYNRKKSPQDIRLHCKWPDFWIFGPSHNAEISYLLQSTERLTALPSIPMMAVMVDTMPDIQYLNTTCT